jgi:hypothetical protein
MKRLSFAALAVVVGLSLLGLSKAGPTVGAGVNLAPNPSFESDPSGAYYTHGAATFSWATDAAHSGTHALKIVSTQPAGTLARWMSQTAAIAATPGTTYTASVYLKTAFASSSARANLSIDFWDSNRAYLGVTADSAQLSGTQPWTSVSTTAKAPPRTAFVRLEFRLFGPGTLWADDVALTAGTPAGSAPVNTALPTISGPFPPDNTMRATTGSWAGSPTSYAYQWYDCVRDADYCAPIDGETGPSLHLPWDSYTKSLKIAVEATNAAGSTRVVSERWHFSADFIVYEPARIIGSGGGTPGTTVGSVLQAVHPEWTGEASVWESIQDHITWLRCGTDGRNGYQVGTGETYTLAPADVGHRIRVVFEQASSLLAGQARGAASAPTPVITAG